MSTMWEGWNFRSLPAIFCYIVTVVSRLVCCLHPFRVLLETVPSLLLLLWAQIMRRDLRPGLSPGLSRFQTICSLIPHNLCTLTSIHCLSHPTTTCHIPRLYLPHPGENVAWYGLTCVLNLHYITRALYDTLSEWPLTLVWHKVELWSSHTTWLFLYLLVAHTGVSSHRTGVVSPLWTLVESILSA